MIATVTEPMHVGTPSRAATGVLAVPVARRQPLDVSRPALPWRMRTVLMDAVDLAGLVLSLPIAVMVLGIPIALAITLLLWIGRLAFGGF